MRVVEWLVFLAPDHESGIWRAASLCWMSTVLVRDAQVGSTPSAISTPPCWRRVAPPRFGSSAVATERRRMRRPFQEQLPLVPTAMVHAHARELQQMSAVLGQLLNTVELIHADLMRRAGKPVDPTKGRDGMTAEQVLRAIVVKQMNGYSYEELMPWRMI
jgi:hypothetical protein